MINTCDAEGKTFNVWLTCWPGDGMDPVGDVDFPDSDEDGRIQWLDREVQNLGWVGVVRVALGLNPFMGNPGAEDELTGFLAEYGIAPGQAFCVRFGNYVGQWVGFEEREWETEWTAEVVAVEPWPGERVLHAWEAWLRGDTDCEL